MERGRSGPQAPSLRVWGKLQDRARVVQVDVKFKSGEQRGIQSHFQAQEKRPGENSLKAPRGEPGLG